MSSSEEPQENESLNQNTMTQNDNHAINRQLQFQRALEKNMRCYIQLSRRVKQLEHFAAAILIVSGLFIMESGLMLATIIITQNHRLILLLLVPGFFINKMTVIISLYVGLNLRKRAKELLEGLLWFQYDTDHQPNSKLSSQFRNFNWIAKLCIIVFTNLQLLLILDATILPQYIEDLDFWTQSFTVEMATFRFLLFLTACLSYSFFTHQSNANLRIYSTITSIQDQEYDQYSPLNKYPTEVVDQTGVAIYRDIVCIICLQDFNLGERLIKLRCHNTHIYHKNCLQEWIASNICCPACRAQI